MNILTTLKDTNANFYNSLKEIESDGRVRGLTMECFVKMPVQRIYRYPLLLKVSMNNQLYNFSYYFLGFGGK